MTTEEKVKAWLYAFQDKNCRLTNLRFNFFAIQTVGIDAVGISLSSNHQHLAALNLYTEEAATRFAAGSTATNTIIFKNETELLTTLRDIHQAISRYWPKKFCTMVGPDSDRSARILANAYNPFAGPDLQPHRIYAFLSTMRGMGYHHTEGYTAAGTTSIFTRRGQRFTFIHKSATVQSPADQVMAWEAILAQATGTPRNNHRRARNKQREAMKEIFLAKRRWRARCLIR